jgi:hypothetical protein
MTYDVALSFAGEDREYVERVAERLQSIGIKVFYDRYEQVDLWGRDLYEHLNEVYQTRARYTVMFISVHYAEKLWTKHERRSAQARALREGEAYILPARFDDTVLPGVTPTTAYIDLRGISPEQLADAICAKLGRSTGGTNPKSPFTQSRPRTSHVIGALSTWHTLILLVLVMISLGIWIARMEAGRKPAIPLESKERQHLTPAPETNLAADQVLPPSLLTKRPNLNEWRTAAGPGRNTSIAIRDTTLYAVAGFTLQSRLLRTGEALWSRQLPDSSRILAVGGSNVFVTHVRSHRYERNPTWVTAIDRLTSSAQWTVTLAASPWAASAHDGLLFVTTHDWLYAVDQETGTIVWRRRMRIEPYAAPIVANGSLYVVHGHEDSPTAPDIEAVDALSGRHGATRSVQQRSLTHRL